MNIVKSARTWAEMNQPQFAEYLSSHTGMSIRFQNVSAWERGKRTVPSKVRNVCLPLAINYALEQCDLIRIGKDKISGLRKYLEG